MKTLHDAIAWLKERAEWQDGRAVRMAEVGAYAEAVASARAEEIRKLKATL